MAQCKQHTINESARDNKFHGKVKRFLKGFMVFAITVLLTSAVILAIHSAYKVVVTSDLAVESAQLKDNRYLVYPVDKRDVYGRDCVIIASNKASFLVCEPREL